MSTALPAATPSMTDPLWVAKDDNSSSACVPTAAEVSRLESALVHANANVSRSSAPTPLGVPAASIGGARSRRAAARLREEEDEEDDEEVGDDDDDEVFDDDEDDSAFDEEEDDPMMEDRVGGPDTEEEDDGAAPRSPAI